MTRREGSATKRLRGESNTGSRFDSPDLLRAMRRCIGAGNTKRVAVQLGLDLSTVYAWGERHPTARPGEHRPRLNGPAKQLAILMDDALDYVDEAQGRDEAEEQKADALAPLHWLCDQFGLRAVDEAAEPASSTHQATALLLKTAGGLVEKVFEFGVDGYDAEERAELDRECRAVEARVRELRLLVAKPAGLRAVAGGGR